MRFVLADGSVITEHQQFRSPVDDQQYVPKTLSAEERVRLGLTEVIEGPRPNEKFYWVRETTPGTYVGEPKNLDRLKVDLVVEIKAHAAALLRPHDWKIVRAASGGKPASEALLAYMAKVRDKSDELEAELLAMTTVQDVEARFSYIASLDWPELVE